MKKLIRILGRIRVKIVRSSQRTKIVVVGMVALSMVALMALNLTINTLRDRAEEARKEAARLEYENSQLEDKIDNLDTPEGLEDAAGEEGYYKPGISVIETIPGQ